MKQCAIPRNVIVSAWLMSGMPSIKAGAALVITICAVLEALIPPDIPNWATDHTQH
jgi:hypothetical protein